MVADAGAQATIGVPTKPLAIAGQVGVSHQVRMGSIRPSSKGAGGCPVEPKNP